MPASLYQRDKNGIRLDLGGGMNLMLPTDLMQQGFPYLQNVRRNLAGRAVARPALGVNVNAQTFNNPITSLVRMNDGLNAALVPPYALIFGDVSGTGPAKTGTLYIDNTLGGVHKTSSLATGFSGKPPSFVTFRPNASPESWCYVADPSMAVTIPGGPGNVPPPYPAPVNGMVKVRADGTIYKTGIAEGQIAPTATATAPLTYSIAGSQSAAPNFTPGETVTQAGSGATAKVLVIVPSSGPMTVGQLTGTPNATGNWTGSSSGAVFTPTAAPEVANGPGWSIYRCVFRSSATGAVSNPSPESVPLALPQDITSQTLVVTSANQTVNYNFNALQWQYQNVSGSQFFRTINENPGVLLDYFIATKFGMNVPATAKIDGIEVSLDWSGESGGSGVLENIALYFQNTPLGVTKSSGVSNLMATAPGVGFFTTLGDNNDTWNADLTPAIVNDASFGFGFQITATVAGGTARSFLFQFAITVYYTPASAEIIISGSTDPQVDKIDVYRQNPALANFTYVSTVPNPGTPGPPPATGTVLFNDTFDDLTISNNPILEFDNFEPFPSIDLPRKGTVNVSEGVTAVTGTGGTGMTPGTYPLVFAGGTGSGAAGTITVLTATTFQTVITNPGSYTVAPTVTAATGGTPPTLTAAIDVTGRVQYASGDPFNARWLPGTIILIGNPSAGTAATAYTLYNRPFASSGSGPPDTLIATNLSTDPVTGFPSFAYPPAGTGLSYEIPEPDLAAQASPVIWGPTPDNLGAFYFGLDPLNPGDLLWSKGNNFDSAPDTNRLFVTSPSEALMNGTVTAELSTVFSAERFWLINWNFADAIATVTGTEGPTWTLTQSAATRGLYMRYAIAALGSTIAYRAKDCIAVSMGGGEEKSLTDDALYNLFPHGGSIPTPVTIGGQTVYPPDDTKPDAQTIALTPSYIFYNYQDTTGTPRTLVYDMNAKGWVVDVYVPTVDCHLWAVTGDSTPSQLLTGCSDGAVRAMLGTGGVEFGTAIIATRSENGGDSRAFKRLGDVFVKAQVDASAPIFVGLWQTRFTVPVTGYAPNALSGSGKLVPYILDFTSGFADDLDDIGALFSWTLLSTSVLDLWQPDWIDLPETVQDRPSDWDDGGNPQNKFVQGMLLECNTFGKPKTFQVETDDGILHTPVEVPFTQNGQAIRSFTFNPPFTGHMMRIVSTDGVPWQFGPSGGWTNALIAQPFPESSTVWATEASSFGMLGWIHIYQINLAYISAAPVTLIVNTDQGSFTLTYPPSAGVANTPSKILLKCPRNKWKVASFSVTSTAPLQLWKDLTEVWMKSWGATEAYMKINPFGAETSPAATI
jgi:hypothetical protein